MINHDVKIYLTGNTLNARLPDTSFSLLRSKLEQAQTGWLSLKTTRGTPLLVNLSSVLAVEVVTKVFGEGPKPGVSLREVAKAQGISFRSLYNKAAKLPLEKLSDRRIATSKKNFDLLSVDAESQEILRELEASRMAKPNEEDDLE
jgi:hypothetical protein